MALFKRFFYRKPPDGLLEITERVFVFDCCFTADIMDDDEYKFYVGSIVAQLREYYMDASFMAFNFREGEKQSHLANILSEYDMTVMDYPRQYESCPLLTMEMIHHFLRSCESWLLLGQRNVLLMHCERGGWPVLAFMLAALLIYRKQYTGEQKTLDMIYKQAPRELLQLMSPLDPLPSQLRYLQYISRRNVGSLWPPLIRALTMDCIILRYIPDMDGEGGCRPIFRIYGPDPLMAADHTPKVLFSTPRRSKLVGQYKQADCQLVKIDINCHIQGDVVLECISLDNDLEHEKMMFRIMFNTAFIRSNILMLNGDEVDVYWNGKDRFPKDFRAEVIFSEMDSTSSPITLDVPSIEEDEGLPIEAFAKVKEIFSNVDLLDTQKDVAPTVLQKITSTNILHEISDSTSLPNTEKKTLRSLFMKGVIDNHLESCSPRISGNDSVLHKESLVEVTDEPTLKILEDNITSSASISSAKQSPPSLEMSADLSMLSKKNEPDEMHFLFRRPTQPKILTQRILQTSLSTPASHCSSQQDSPMSILRYPSAPSFLGITALLHDRAEPIAYQVSHPLISSPVSAGSSYFEHLSSPVQSTIISNLQSSQPPSSPLPLEATTVTTTALTSRCQPSPLPTLHRPHLSETESLLSLLDQGCGTMPQVGRHMSEASPPPPSSHSQSSPFYSKQNPSLPSHASSSVINSVSSLPISSVLLPVETTTTLKSSAVPPPPPPPTPRPPHLLSDPEPLQDYGTPIVGSVNSSSVPPPPPSPPPPPPLPGRSLSSSSKSSCSSTTSAPPPHRGAASSAAPRNSIPPPPPLPTSSEVGLFHSTNNSSLIPPPPPPLPSVLSAHTDSLDSSQLPRKQLGAVTCPPPPPPPPICSEPAGPMKSKAPPPPPTPGFASKGPLDKSSLHVPPVPPPPAPLSNGFPKAGGTASNGNIPPIPGPPLTANGKLNLRAGPRNQGQSSRKTNLKPYHWLKLTRAMQGSLWAETQKSDEASKVPEFDMSELESLFSANVPNSDLGNRGGKSNRSASGGKPEKVSLIDLRRAYNCEIMLTKVKIPLPDLMSAVLALDNSALDIDQVENLIKFCPTKEEMELLKNYNGEKENLGKCEQFFFELMKVPRVEAKLRVFAFKIQFSSQVSDLRRSLNTVNAASEEVRNSVKLKRIMQTILSLGNALNHGTARGSAVGFRLDSLLKLTDTRARNNKLTLMHYLCKVLAEKLPELLDFHLDLVSLENSTKIQLKYLAEEMQAISKGLEKIVQELAASENDGPVSETFCHILKEFLGFAEAEVRSLASLYSVVGKNADALAFYFGEDPAKCPFEQVVSTLRNFVRMFVRAHEENCKQLEFEKKKAQKEAENEKGKPSTPRKKSETETLKSKESAEHSIET